MKSIITLICAIAVFLVPFGCGKSAPEMSTSRYRNHEYIEDFVEFPKVAVKGVPELERIMQYLDDSFILPKERLTDGIYYVSYHKKKCDDSINDSVFTEEIIVEWRDLDTLSRKSAYGYIAWNMLLVSSDNEVYFVDKKRLNFPSSERLAYIPVYNLNEFKRKGIYKNLKKLWIFEKRNGEFVYAPEKITHPQLIPDTIDYNSPDCVVVVEEVVDAE